ncbi:DUF2339 domain-containing protein [Methyloversatilis discipulorum]|uniref:DUF2339 domain-containing protein n=1 Tax=Methyloversatilis discipulorum TaxID=1119528 RepID=UPI00036A6B1B|nr:DUF2339 domain-containing protein [Methyloversatilis discipulorum]
MLTAILCVLGLIAGAAHGEIEAFFGALAGLAGGLWVSARAAARERAVQERLRELDDKTRWLYEALKSRPTAPASADVTPATAKTDTTPSATEPPPADATLTEPPAVSTQAAPLDALHAEGVRIAARPQPSAAERDDITRPLATLWSRLMGSNPLARIGVIVLFFGVASALRLAAQAGWLPPELRLAAAVATGAAMIGFGLRLPGDGPRRMFALAVQGGGFALLYLAVYFALARYGFIGPAPAFLLFAALGVACAVAAARQSSQVLALLGLSGAFVAPMLASSGQGQYVVLFSYYLLLDAFIIALSWRRAWRALIFAGFLFTFAVGAGWGLRSYVADDYLVVQGFLIAFFVLFTATHVAQTVLRAPGAAGWQSGSLLFGPPLAAGVLQAALVQPYEYGAAISAALAGVYYLGLASLLRSRAPDEVLTFRAHAGIGAALLTLAVPLAFDLQMTAAIYAVEGAAALWYGCARASRLTLWAGAALQVAAGFWLAASLDTLTVAWPLLNGRTLGCLLLAGAALSSVRVLRQSGAGADWLPKALTLWLAGWWLFGGLADIDDFVPYNLQPAIALLFGVASAAFAEQQGRTRDFITARALAALTLPVLWAGSLLAWDQHDHLLYGAMALALPLAWATHLWVLRRQDEDGAALLNTPRHIATAWTLLLSVGIEAGGWLADWLPAQDLWGWLVWIAVWLAAGRTLQAALSADGERTDAWPWAAAPEAYARAVLWPVAGLLLLTVVALQFGHDGGSALPYLPLASALDLASMAALLWLARSRLLPRPLVGAAGLLWVSALAARGVHHLAGVAWSAAAMFQSTLLQATLSLTWALTALALMVYATRSGARTLWFAGFALLAAVGAKMLMIDLAGAGTVEWTGSLLGIGALILIASYVAPVPPGTLPDEEDTR